MNFDTIKVIRDQAIFVASLFSIYGIIAIDAYYYAFGIKYQFLALNATHIVYKGFSLIYINYYFFTIFVLILVGVAVSGAPFKLQIAHIKIKAVTLGMSILSASLLIGSWLAFQLGLETAASVICIWIQHLCVKLAPSRVDLLKKTSYLPS